MRHFLLGAGLLALPLLAPAQTLNGWTRITDSANPITTFATPGPYKGAAWVDVNNDGWLDLFAAPNGLFLGQGGGQFIEATTPIGARPGQLPSGCSWADLDNDGDLDMVLAQFPSAVYLNNGNATFQDITSRFPGLNSYAAWAAAFGDVNQDQKLDLILVHANGFHPASATPMPCSLYLQQATGTTFQPRLTGHAFTDSLGAYTVPYWTDYDLDGDQDLFIASGTAATAELDFCYKNLWAETGTATLQRMTTEAFAAQRQDGQQYSFIDVDNDLDLDLCLTNYGAAPTRFFLNQNGQYVAAPAPFAVTGQHLSNSWGDFDNDGDQDVFITSDSRGTAFYRNNGHGMFLAAPSMNGPAGGAGLVAGDYDNDGDLDVFINGRVAAPAAVGLYRNDGAAAGCNWVNIRLTGTASNRSALGARVMLKASINGQPTWQLRTVSAQNSFQGQHDLRVHFGLNQATTIDSLVVVWPAGGRQRFGPLAPNRFYALTEGQGLNVVTATRPAELSLPLAVRVSPVPARDHIVVELAPDRGPAQLTLTDGLGRVRCEMTAVGARTILPLMNMAAGIYHLDVRRGEQVFTTKVVRE
jgi:hypothetical protein